MNVLSLFDGISCGQLALKRAGISYDKYYASEIDKYAIKVTQNNFPNTIQLGDVREIKAGDLPKIDLLIGGSPCQGFSFAGKGLNFDDPRSKLFFEYVRLIKQLKPRYFLLENVRMKKESEKVISDCLGVQPIAINSSIVSAQSRNRLYWTNIDPIGQILDKSVYWDSIQETDARNVYYITPKMQAWIDKVEIKKGVKIREYYPADKKKMQMIEASHFKGISNQRFFKIKDVQGWRYISPIECERLQTLPDNYTQGISNTQRYRAIGNGWTVDVVAHIFKNIEL